MNETPARTLKNATWLIVAIVVIATIIFIADLMIPLGVAMGVPYVGIVLLTLWISSQRSTWVVAILASVLIGLGFVLSESSDELWKVVFNRGLALGVVWTSAVLVVYQKITSRQMKDVAMLHESVLNTAAESIFTIDSSRRLLSVNPAAKKLFGYTEKELIGCNVNMLMPEPYRSKHDQYIDAYLLTAEKKVMGTTRDVIGRHKDGHDFPIELSVSESLTESGHFFIGIIRDITARKRWESEIRKRTEQLEESNRQLDEFAYIASHDLRAPLRAVDNLANWIAEDAEDVLPEASKRHLKLLMNRIERMENLLKELLEYSRIGRVKHPIEVVDTGKLTQDIISMFSLPTDFIVTASDDMPTFATWKVPLDQVLRNLIGNAIKHHDRSDGHVAISVAENDHTYEFAVKDDGPGIRSEFYGRVFKMFQTLKPRDDVEGSGVGLALVKKIVEAHDGKVSVEANEEGRGAVFRFTWPKVAEES